MIDEQDLAALQRSADDPATVPATRIEAYFALGSGLEQRGADQAAFAPFKAGSRLKHDALIPSPDPGARPDALERAHDLAARFVVDGFDQAYLERQFHRRGTSAAPT